MANFETIAIFFTQMKMKNILTIKELKEKNFLHWQTRLLMLTSTESPGPNGNGNWVV
jgi:hypothetical protein